jgi:Uma2 family endonuclease
MRYSEETPPNCSRNMVAYPPLPPTTEVFYPEADGKPMSDNTVQFRWIVTIKENLEILYAADPMVFVAGDLLWYPVQGNNKLSQAPDAMVVFGRPKQDRGSYQQWQEGNIAPQVVFEILSPSNTVPEMTRKLLFYQQYGAEEYYVYDPYRNELVGSCRDDQHLIEIADMQGWVSPRLGIRFEVNDTTLVIYAPNGDRFLTPVELAAQRDQERQRADQESQRADQEHQRAERLAERLRSLGIDPETV